MRSAASACATPVVSTAKKPTFGKRKANGSWWQRGDRLVNQNSDHGMMISILIRRRMNMAKGSTGVETNVIIQLKKPDRIQCDCERCRHSKRAAGTLYCTYYDIISPKRKTCARYWCVKPAPKNRKVKNTSKSRSKKK